MTEHPLISVMIPVFNAANYLRESIQSVLDQTYDSIEIIVVDDGSEDDSLKVAQEFLPRIRLFEQRHAGIGAARNLALSKASGDYFAFVDADDLCKNNRFSKQVQVLYKEKGIEAVFGQARQFFSSDLSAAERKKIRFVEGPFSVDIITTILIRKKAFFRIGLFNTDLRVGNDLEWIIRAKHNGLMYNHIQECIYLRRLHRTNNVRVNKMFGSDRLNVLKQHLDWKRARH